MTDAQTEAREIETQAWCCDEWPEWLHKIVDETCEVADRLDMSAEQAHAYAVLAALAAKDEKIQALNDECQQSMLDIARERDRAERAEAQLAEAKEELDVLRANQIAHVEVRARLTDQLAEARKALEPFAALADIFDHKGGNRPTTGLVAQWSDHRVGDRDLTVENLRAARLALTGGENG